MSGPFKMKGWSPFTAKTKTVSRKEDQPKEEFHTSGVPEVIYDANNEAVNTVGIDEGNFSAIKGSGNNRYVVATEDSDKYVKGERFNLSKQ